MYSKFGHPFPQFICRRCPSARQNGKCSEIPHKGEPTTRGLLCLAFITKHPYYSWGSRKAAGSQYLFLFICMSVPYFIYPSTIDTCNLPSLGLWKMPLWSFTYQSLGGHVFTFLWGVESPIKCVYNFLLNCQTVFQTDCTILNSHQRHMQFLVSPPYPGR